MNYLLEIKLFYDWLETHELTPSGIALWHGLMHIANRSGWKFPLAISYALIEQRTGMTRSTIKREREKLEKAGLLEMRFGQGRNRSKYRLLSLTTHFVAHLSVQIEPQAEPQSVPLSEKTDVVAQLAVHSEPQTVPPIYKLNYTDISKEKNIKEMDVGGEPPPSISPEKREKEKSCGKKEKEKKAPQIDTTTVLETIDPPWRELMHTWLEYKRTRKESYRSEIGIRKCLSMLQHLSRGSVQIAEQIIDKSIANNWAGLFELKQSNYPARGHPATGQHIGQIMQPEDDEHRRKILEKFGKPKK